MRNIVEAKLAEIPVPGELHDICVKTIRRMKTQRIRRLAAAVAAAACVCMLPALASGLYGHYREVYRGTAITGGIMADADNDFALSAYVEDDGSIHLKLKLMNAEEISYRYTEELQLDEIVITDDYGNTVYSDAEVSMSMEDMNVTIAAELPPGEYFIEVRGMTGLSKGDGPLPIQGTWHCPLTIK